MVISMLYCIECKSIETKTFDWHIKGGDKSHQLTN